jgi:2'-5' RNA ligase
VVSVTVESVAKARLFFAAWPGPEIQQALHDLARQAQPECGGRAIPARNIHLTLAFLGDIERARMTQLDILAAAIEGSGCELVIDRLGYWRHNRILWAGAARCPAPLQALVSSLSMALRGAGYTLEERPYVPHVTLLRDARRAGARLAFSPAVWPVRDFALVESVQTGRERIYEVVRRWSLEC